MSILRLLHPLTEPESSPPKPDSGKNRLDAALDELQNVARKLAISHTKQVKATPTCTQIKLLTLTIPLQSQSELILVGMLLRGMFALFVHILMELNGAGDNSKTQHISSQKVFIS